MSPCARGTSTDSRGFPRVSGDEPQHGEPLIDRFLFSPRERG